MPSSKTKSTSSSPVPFRIRPCTFSDSLFQATSTENLYFFASAFSVCSCSGEADLPHGAIAPSLKDLSVSGTTSAGSIFSCSPSPSHAGHAPNGLLNENSRGSISGMVKPETGQANLAEKVSRLGSSPSFTLSANSATAIPSARPSAVSKLSASRCSIPALMTIRSTTTSMSCFSFLSSFGGSSSS